MSPKDTKNCYNIQMRAKKLSWILNISVNIILKRIKDQETWKNAKNIF